MKYFIISILLSFLFVFPTIFSEKLTAQTSNDDIENIELVRPYYDTIVDPDYEKIEVKITLSEPTIWGTEPPEGIISFSLQNNMDWIPGTDLVNSPEYSRFYVCEYPINYILDRIDNSVFFKIIDPLNTFDTVAQFDVFYNKPIAELLDIENSEITNNLQIYVVNSVNPECHFKIGSVLGSIDYEKDDYVLGLEIRHNNSPNPNFIKIWEAPDETGVEEWMIPFNLNDTFNIIPGINSFTIRSEGKRAEPSIPVEYSNEFEFMLFYLDFNWGVLADTTCQVNEKFQLLGMPEGGRFSGNGIISETNRFNPFFAEVNQYNEISYSYLIDGEEFSVTDDIYILPKPVIEIEGPVQVCKNSTDVKYSILNPDLDKYIYHWDFIGVIEIIDSTATSRTVHWGSGINLGKIVVTLEGAGVSFTCPAHYDYLIDIDPDTAPDKACVFYGDNEKRFLLSANTNAKYYKWYVNGTDSIGFTTNPYFFITDDIIKYHNITLGESEFSLHTSNQVNGCYTISYMCPENYTENKNYLGFLFRSGLSFTIVPNPVHDQFKLQLTGSFTGNIIVDICNINNQAIFSTSISKSNLIENVNVKIPGNFSPGLYFVRCIYEGVVTQPVKMIIY